MRYALMRKFDISNGRGIGISLFVQGCPFHCKDCFNPETWDFGGGKEWTDEDLDRFIDLSDKSYIQRISILGGEPLCQENIDEVCNICKAVKQNNPDIVIWVYTGDNFENINHEVLKYIDVLVDGRFVSEKKDFNLKFKGSSNQRIIDVKKTLKTGKIVLYEVD